MMMDLAALHSQNLQKAPVKALESDTRLIPYLNSRLVKIEEFKKKIASRPPTQPQEIKNEHLKNDEIFTDFSTQESIEDFKRLTEINTDSQNKFSKTENLRKEPPKYTELIKNSEKYKKYLSLQEKYVENINDLKNKNSKSFKAKEIDQVNKFIEDNNTQNAPSSDNLEKSINLDPELEEISQNYSAFLSNKKNRDETENDPLKKTKNFWSNRGNLSKKEDFLNFSEEIERAVERLSKNGKIIKIEELLEKFRINPEEFDSSPFYNMPVRWSDFHSPVHGFKSTLEQKSTQVKFAEVQVSIEKEKGKDIACGQGSFLQISVEIQTEDDKSSDFLSERGDGSENKPYPYPLSLFAFFSKVSEGMMRELQENILQETNMFLGSASSQEEKFYKPVPAYEAIEEKIEKLRSRRQKLMLKYSGNQLPHGIFPIEAAWSPNGSFLAVIHGAVEHLKICSHNSVPFRIFSLIGSPPKISPIFELTFDACASALAYHPKKGTLISIGFNNGEIGLVDLDGAHKANSRKFRQSLEEQKIKSEHGSLCLMTNYYTYTQGDASITLDASGHSQKITSLKWVHLSRQELSNLGFKPTASPYGLISSSLDGFFSIWSIDRASFELSLERKFGILSLNIPENYKEKSESSFLRLKQIPISSFDVFKSIPTQFVCATFGNFIFRGSFISDDEYRPDEVDVAVGLNEKVRVYSPNPLFLLKENENLDNIKCFEQNSLLFSYITQKGRICLRSYQSTESNEAVFETILPNRSRGGRKHSNSNEKIWAKLNLCWSPSRPLVFSASKGSSIYFYDLLLQLDENVFKIESDETDVITSVAFNKEEKRMIACTTSNGFVQIWKIPQEFYTFEYTELEELEKLGGKEKENED